MAAQSGLGRKRLMLDISELIEHPYPNIDFRLCGDNMSSGCLILSPEGLQPLHLSVTFDQEYPLNPPSIRMNSQINHPNVYGSYICATILRKTEEYTPAYTLKAIAIQMLSFFGSESIEQEHGDRVVDLKKYQMLRDKLGGTTDRGFKCTRCDFDALSLREREGFIPRVVPGADASSVTEHSASIEAEPLQTLEPEPDSTRLDAEISINRLLDKDLLLVLENIDDFEHLMSFAQAWPRVSQLIRDYNIVRQRELQCFVLKKIYKTMKLGVGVSINRGHLASEFDLVSHQAFHALKIRQSVHNIPFTYWLPLPISWRHWKLVRDELVSTLQQMKLGLDNAPPIQVLYHFMNDIVVRLNEVANSRSNKRGYAPKDRSSLRHASEKAIESYFHLFHILACMACENPVIVAQANTMLQSFAEGKRSKVDCPSLGHLLVALLISDVEVTEDLRKAIIIEAITRNVVWLLDSKGANMPELAYLETSSVSAYRLEQTFLGSLTSYRLLMFSELFRRAARPAATGPQQKRKTLLEVRDELFVRHGAPPPGCASWLSSEVRRLHDVRAFPSFFREMGVKNIPTTGDFTALLRQTVTDSVAKGYSAWLPQHKALGLRLQVEPGVDCDSTLRAQAYEDSDLRLRGFSFFPNQDRNAQNRRRHVRQQR
ncbi:hypothetical protein B0I35DRAFT_444334 [Stachybotrys elegans]|uniref:UBC core domain-containing protein n=1 Tax=Stachybotrys elegans TaxID=80388 RepID=A0A8K0SGK7_9HYPO|nr:hypothetical protein B0I35DRAFT_444334 [Stachybotrys elegans]